MTRTWKNWVGNHRCSPAETAAPSGEDEIVSLVAGAAARGLKVRVAGAGHSFTPVVATDGLLLYLRGLPRIRHIDRERSRVVVGPATTIGEFGEPLWEAGLALANQGDIVAQQIAGAVATGTHGSGLRLGSFSSSVRRLRLVTAAGDVRDIGEDDPELLHAAQLAIGMLGVVTELELEVTPAYRLRWKSRASPGRKRSSRIVTGRDTAVISISGMPGTDYWPYLREVDELLGEFDARVHWGKLHFLTRDQLLARYPRAETFIELRRSLDPAGTFLNDHLQPLFD